MNSEGFLYLGVCVKKWDSWKRNWSKNVLIKIVVLLRMLNLLIIIYEIKDQLPLQVESCFHQMGVGNRGPKLFEKKIIIECHSPGERPAEMKEIYM